MKRLNVQFEEHVLQQVKLVAAVENKSVAAVLRDATKAYLATKTDLKQKLDEIIYANDADFNEAMNQSFSQFDSVYKKLAE